MAEWQQAWQSMRAQFLPRARQRLENTAAILARASAEPENAEIVEAILKDMHWLAGVGGTYKLNGISDIGVEAEEICRNRILDAQPLSAADISRLQEILSAALEQIDNAS